LRNRLISILTLIYVLTSFSLAKETKVPISIEADKIERKNEKVIASGNVHVKYKDFNLSADKIIYNSKNKKILLKGNIFLTGKNVTIYAKEGWIDIQGKEGEFKDITFILEGKYFVRAKKLWKKGDYFYFKKGEFSQCRLDQYDWYIKAHKGKVKEEDKLQAYNLTFRFFNIPIFYAPYFTYPTVRRKTGFLTPEFGRDSYNNIFVKIPFFYVLDKSSDITATVDYRSGQGEGLNLEYRKKFSKRSRLTAEFFYFRDKGNGGWWEGRDTAPLENRWRLKGKGFFHWKEFNIYANVDLPSDPYFYEDFYNVSDLRYLSYTKSQVLATQNKKNYTLEINFDYIYDLSSPTNRYTLQRLPEVRFYYKKKRLLEKFPIYADFLSVNTNFYREAGEKAIRSDNAINIGLYTPFRGFFNDLEIIPRYTAYFFINGNLKNSRYRSLVQIKDTLRYPFYNRFSKFSLFTIPQIEFNNVPASSQGKLPFFDKEDRLRQKSDIDISLFNIANFDNDSFLRWEISTGYARKGIYFVSDTPYKGYWKPLKNSLLFEINGYKGEQLLYFDFKLGYITRSITSLTVPFGKNVLYTITHSFDKGLEEKSLNQIYQKLSARYKNFLLEASLLNNIKDGYTQQKRLKLTYDRKCWSFSIKYIEDYNVDSGKTFSSIVLSIDILSTQYKIPFVQSSGYR
jgi:LPS-assembly protein